MNKLTQSAEKAKQIAEKIITQLPNANSLADRITFLEGQPSLQIDDPSSSEILQIGQEIKLALQNLYYRTIKQANTQIKKFKKRIEQSKTIPLSMKMTETQLHEVKERLDKVVRDNKKKS